MRMDSESKVPNIKLRHQRELRGWSQKRLADAIDTSKEMVSKWEGGQKPGKYYQEKLCELFGMTAQELGFISKPNQPVPLLHDSADQTPLAKNDLQGMLAQTVTQSIIGAVRELGNQDMDNLRRQILQQAIGATSATVIVPSPRVLLESDLLERLMRTLKRPSSIDGKTLTYLEMTMRVNRQRFLRSQKSVAMLLDVSALLQTITQLLEQSHSQQTCERLYTFAGETTQLIGDILFNAGDNDTAEQYYNIALEMAKEAHNDVLYAVILGRKSFIPIYRGDAQNALPLLEEARLKAENKASDLIVSWLWAIEAEAYANIYTIRTNDSTSDRSLRALEQSEILLKRGKEREVSSTFADMAYAPFDANRLLGYKGICHVRLQNALVAQMLLKARLSSMDGTHIHKKSIALVDLATTYVQLGEIEEACTYVAQALNLLEQTRSARVFQRVLDFRSRLDRWSTTLSVKSLDALIVTVLPSIQIQGVL
jgi:transcriptional regulator with XRE-family HTH domain/tetratricopeptide (TPR) repeat protein